MSTDSNSPSSTTCGPVASVADHVASEWWRDLFDDTYLLTDGDVLSEGVTHHEVDRYVEHASLSPNDRILDLCCGQGRHALDLARRGFAQVRGLDQSAFLIDVARRGAEEEGHDATFDHGDARSLPYDDNSFDVVLLVGNSFGYFEEAGDDVTVLQEVRRVLAPGGRVLLDLADGDYLRTRFDARSWEWSDDEHLVCRERELTDGRERLAAREIVIDIDQGVASDRFYAERLYGRREISFLLRRLGFDPPAFATMKGRSEREEDLGMMHHRFIVSASIPAEESAPESGLNEGVAGGGNGVQTHGGTSGPPDAMGSGAGMVSAAYGSRRGEKEDRLPRYVAVVLGDPRKPDATKRGGMFGEADYEVRDKLRDALAELSGYEFIYFDDHDSLIDDLRTYGEAVDLVFNLCDEGFQNEPRQELHIPALLEAFGIPYTGAGPQCLAHCYDKSIVRGVASEMNFPVAGGYVLRANTPLPDRLPVSFPVIVKPNAADNSAGMTTDCIADGWDELESAIRSVRDHVGSNATLLVEEFLSGADLTYGVIGNPSTHLRSLPITQEDYSRLPADLPRFCGYEAKWAPESPYWTDVESVPADLPDRTRMQIRRGSHLLFERLGCRDYARFDWRLDDEGNPHLLEVNPNPGWCWDCHLVSAAALHGFRYSELLGEILETAYRRCGIEAAGSIEQGDGG